MLFCRDCKWYTPLDYGDGKIGDCHLKPPHKVEYNDGKYHSFFKQTVHDAYCSKLESGRDAFGFADQIIETYKRLGVEMLK